MPDYAKMYHTLFNAMTDSIEMLQQAQQKTEEMYLSGEAPEIHILKQKSDKTDQE